MNSADLVVQKAVKAKLDDVLSVGVYDTAPDGTSFPYVTIGSSDTRPFQTKTWNGSNVFHDIHVWSNSNTPSEGKGISSAIISALHDNILLPLGAAYSLIDTNLERELTTKDKNGIRHTVVSFRFYVKES